MKQLLLAVIFCLVGFIGNAQALPDTTKKPVTVWVLNTITNRYEQRYIYRIIQHDEIIGYLDEKKEKPIDKKLVKEGL